MEHCGAAALISCTTSQNLLNIIGSPSPNSMACLRNGYIGFTCCSAMSEISDLLKSLPGGSCPLWHIMQALLQFLVSSICSMEGGGGMFMPHYTVFLLMSSPEEHFNYEADSHDKSHEYASAQDFIDWLIYFHRGAVSWKNGVSIFKASPKRLPPSPSSWLTISANSLVAGMGNFGTNDQLALSFHAPNHIARIE